MHFPRIALIALAGVTGCGASVEKPSSSESAAGSPARTPATPIATAGGAPANAATPPSDPGALDRVDDNLARLRALELFEVGDMIVELPAEATNCYGKHPCAGSEAAVLAARTTAAEHLAAFTDTAERAVAMPYDAYACGARIDVNLEALRGLQIVDIGSFVRSQPANNPSCYNTPCPSDQQAADAVNEARATDLESIVIYTAPTL